MLDTFTDLLASAGRRGNELTITIPESWQQGRATYGGVTAAICLEAARPLADDRPPRSAQVAFVGPAGGSLRAIPTVLRRGKNTVFVSVQLTNDLGVAAEAIVVFGARRESQLASCGLVAPEAPDPDDCGRFLQPSFAVAGFATKFDMRPISASDEPLFGRDSDTSRLSMWLRHGDGSEPVDAVSVFGLADGPPPTAAVTLSEPAPLSTMTWMAEFLVDDFSTTDGWFLADHVDQYTARGYSSQAMTLYNVARQPVMVGHQSITIFA